MCRPYTVTVIGSELPWPGGVVQTDPHCSASAALPIVTVGRAPAVVLPKLLANTSRTVPPVVGRVVDHDTHVIDGTSSAMVGIQGKGAGDDDNADNVE